MDVVQWNLLIRTLSGPVILSFVERLSSFFYRSVYTSTFSLFLLGVCPLVRSLSSFGVSFIRAVLLNVVLMGPPMKEPSVDQKQTQHFLDPIKCSLL